MPPLATVLVVAEIEGKYATRPERPGSSDKRPLQSGLIGQVIEDMADRNDRVGFGNRIAEQDEVTDLLCSRRVLPCQVEHCRRGVGRDNAVSRADQMPGEGPRPAAQLHDEAAPRAHGSQ